MNDRPTNFSDVGSQYGDQLARGLQVTGEGADYYARQRIERMQRVVTNRGKAVTTILDFGCGIGGSFALLREFFPRARILGFEPAKGLRTLAAAAATRAGADVFVLDGDVLSLDRRIDLVYCNGVFHHIALAARDSAMQAIGRSMRGNGLLFLWENSPFNPGTRWVMSRIAFDRDARLLRPGQVRALQQKTSLRYVRTEFHFVFPHVLRMLRVTEPLLRAFPVGGQYVVIGERPPVPDPDAPAGISVAGFIGGAIELTATVLDGFG